MKKISLIAALALGSLVACSNLAKAQDSSTNSADAAPKKEKGKRGFPTVEQQMERMTTELSLTDEQKPKVKAVLEDSNKQRQGLRDIDDQDERRNKMRSIMEDQNKKMKDILTPDQYEKYQAMRQGMGKGGKKKTDGQ